MNLLSRRREPEAPKCLTAPCGTSELNRLYADLACRDAADLDFRWHGWSDNGEAEPWFVTADGIDGCWATGATPGQAVAELKETIHGWLDLKWSDGDGDIPVIHGFDYMQARREGWVVSHSEMSNT